MIFTKLYDTVLRWAKHPHAVYYLCFISFIEAIFFPIPVAMMLAPMILAKPRSAWWYVGLCTLFSVTGGIIGYALGFFFFEILSPWLHEFHYWDAYLTARSWMENWGVGAIFLAGFSPIPYKIATIAAGVLQMNLLSFIVASIIGRAAQFSLVAALFSLGGEHSEQMIRRYVEWIGWIVVLIALVLFFFIKD